MCGIAGITSASMEAISFLVNSLEFLNTRGYDGYGVATSSGFIKKVGEKELPILQNSLIGKNLSDKTGIAHNRWATHGIPSAVNSHPHMVEDIILVHNGDLCNYLPLKKELEKAGYVFNSETDSEVLSALIAFNRRDLPLFEAVRKAVESLDESSTLAILVLDLKNPDQIIAVRRGSNPILWAYEKGTVFISSEAGVFGDFVDHFQEVQESSILLFSPNGLERKEMLLNKTEEDSIAHVLDRSHYSNLEKSGDYWMHQEILEAPEVILSALGKRVTVDDGIVLGGIGDKIIQEKLRGIKKIFLAGCGTSYHSALVVASYLQEVAQIDAEAIVASEAIYSSPIFDSSTTALVVISQSGETADVVRLMREWKPKGVLMLGIVNVPNSQIARLTDAGIYCHVGKEISVASTKAFLGQVICGFMFALSLGQQRNLSLPKRNIFIEELLLLATKAQDVLSSEQQIKDIAYLFKDAINFLFIGRRYGSIVALEGALKLKEITWQSGTGINALGLPSGEMKHGTLAMISESFPTFAIATEGPLLKPVMNNISEILARKGRVIVITDTPKSFDNWDVQIIAIPKTSEYFLPVLATIPTQLFAYHSAIARGCNPDMPNNLAKAVTVE